LPKYHTAKLFCKVKLSLFSSFENTENFVSIYILQPFIKACFLRTKKTVVSIQSFCKMSVFRSNIWLFVINLYFAYSLDCLQRYTLKEYSLSFTSRTLFYSIIFLNPSRSSYSKFILYINYHLYLIIFSTTNFFSLIPISTT
jgi:hypothetical protein